MQLSYLVESTLDADFLQSLRKLYVLTSVEWVRAEFTTLLVVMVNKRTQVGYLRFTSSKGGGAIDGGFLVALVAELLVLVFVAGHNVKTLVSRN